jgi:hypothetical protein
MRNMNIFIIVHSVKVPTQKIELLPPRNIINLLDNDYESRRDQEDINELYFALDFYKNLSIERLDRIQELKNEFEKSVVNSAINKCNLEVVNAENQKLKLDLELLNKKYSVVFFYYKNSMTDNSLILNYQQRKRNSRNSKGMAGEELHLVGKSGRSYISSSSFYESITRQSCTRKGGKGKKRGVWRKREGIWRNSGGGLRKRGGLAKM